MKDIAVVILNRIQYDNIVSGLEELKKSGFSVDIYCSHWDEDSSGMNNMFDDITDYCEKNNFNVYRKVDPKIEYKVLLEPYPCLDISAKYKIKYRYSNISAKPNIVYKPENYIMYDAILCSGNYDSNYLSVFSKTYKTANLKYENFKKSEVRKSNKKQLLYLPTYGDESSIEQIINILEELKEHYYIVAKIHHGTNYLANEHNRINLLKDKVDELYDSNTPLTALLETTDVILTDNSGSIFEGIFTEIPVAVFCDDINKNKTGDFNTTQYELYKEGILPFTNNPNEIVNILKEALSESVIKKQREWNRTNFFHPEDFTTDFVNVIKMYLNEEFDKRYYQMHNVLKNSYYTYLHENQEELPKLKAQIAELQNALAIQKNINSNLESNVDDLNSQVDSLSRQVDYYNTGTLYKFAKKIYRLKNGD
ncbi:MAG: hypothetical protein IJP34_04500 [Clostridia bacterium]|nr:hypothetical protein [Clostridia bacterium]